MTTYSQLVDAMVLECRRPDLQTEICAYTNQTLRDLHINPDTNTLVFYKDNYNDVQLTATSDTGFSWTAPNPQTLQGINPAQYLSVCVVNGQNVNEPWTWAYERPIGKNMKTHEPWMYRAGTTVYFNHYGGTNALINFSWYEFTRALNYYPVGSRPCTWDNDAGFTYYAPYGLNNAPPNDPTTAQFYATNWILQRWEDTVKEGVRAKVYKRLSDTTRAQTAYSMFQQMRKAIISAESAQPNGAY